MVKASRGCVWWMNSAWRGHRGASSRSCGWWITSSVDVLLMLTIYADIHDGGLHCVVIGIPCSHMWRVCLNPSRVKNSKPDPIVYFYSGLNPNFLPREVANLTFTNLTLHLKLSALFYRRFCCHYNEHVLFLPPSGASAGIADITDHLHRSKHCQSGTHWERWGRIENHFTLS